MTLAELTASRGTMKRIAMDADISLTYLYGVARRVHWASLSMAVRIERATNKKVMAETMVHPSDLENLAYLRGENAATGP